MSEQSLTTNKNIEDAVEALERMREDFDDLRGHPTAVADFNTIREVLQNACARDEGVVRPIKSLTLGDKYIGKITEQEAVDLVNAIIQSQIDCFGMSSKSPDEALSKLEQGS
jgi:hypothetical protein